MILKLYVENSELIIILLPHKHNAKNRPHYTEFYDDELIEIVNKFYKNDIKILGYKYGEN